MPNSRICLDITKEFSILTIGNKNAKNVLILQSLLRVSNCSIGIPKNFSYEKVENLDNNNKSDKSDVKIKI